MREKPAWGVGAPPPPLRVDGLSRLETEKHQAGWGRAGALAAAFPTSTTATAARRSRPTRARHKIL